MIRHGYALVKLSDNVVIQTWDSNVTPPNDIFVPEAKIAVHGITAGDVGSTFEGYRLVERQLDDQGPVDFQHEYAPDQVTYDNSQVIVTKTLIALEGDALTAGLQSQKVAMQSQVDLLWEEKALETPFSYDFGGSIGIKQFQTRAEDEPRWLAAKDECRDARDASNLSGTTILRPADNVNVTLTYQQAMDMLNAMRSQQRNLLGYSWQLKDTISEATDHATLDAIDITVGWP